MVFCILVEEFSCTNLHVSDFHIQNVFCTQWSSEEYMGFNFLNLNPGVDGDFRKLNVQVT